MALSTKDKNKLNMKIRAKISLFFLTPMLILVIGGLGVLYYFPAGYVQAKVFFSFFVLIAACGAVCIIDESIRSFNKMTVTIKRSEVETDAKIKAQNEETTLINEQLKDQQAAILNILEDINQEKENVLRERDKVNAILYNIGDGVFVVDEDYKIIIFNQAAEKISGFSETEVVGKRYDEMLNFIFGSDSSKNNKFISDSMVRGELCRAEGDILLIRKDGRKIVVDESASPLKNDKGDVIGCVIVFRDVTEERRIDQAKSEFVSLASHQLRTPLTAISWFTELLLKKDIGKLNKKQEEFLKEIYASNKRMIDLVGALLNVSRIELGTLAVTPKLIDFVKIIRDVIDEFGAQIRRKKLKVIKYLEEDLPLINADANLIRIVFQNIISNAIKYTPNKGRIEISLSRQSSDVLFKVTDTGYGIPKYQQSKVFTKLFRADNVVGKETDGTGLGLYIVKAVVEQSGGVIWFESEEDKGSAFFITIPLKGMKTQKGVKGLIAENGK